MIQIACICKEYGWTEDQYLDQSEEFIGAVIARRQVEATVESDKLKEMEQRT